MSSAGDPSFIILTVPGIIIFPVCLFQLHRYRNTEYLRSRDVTNAIANGILMLAVLIFLGLDHLFQSRPHIFDLLACFAFLPALMLNLALKGFALNVRYRAEMAKAYLSAPPSQSLVMLGTKDDEWYLQNQHLSDMKNLNKYAGIALCVHSIWVLLVWLYSDYPLEKALGVTRIVTMLYTFALALHIGWRLLKLLEVRDAFWLKKEIKWSVAALSPTTLALAFASSEPSFDFVTLILSLGVWVAFICAVVVPLNKARRGPPDRLGKEAYPLDRMLEDELNLQRFKAYLVREFNVETLMAWREAQEFRKQVFQNPHLKSDRIIGHTLSKAMERIYQLYMKNDAACKIPRLPYSVQQHYAGDFGPGDELLRGKKPGEDVSATGNKIDENYFSLLQEETLKLLHPAYIRFCVKEEVVFMMPHHSA